jgi:HlyD family secretion protein
VKKRLWWGIGIVIVLALAVTGWWFWKSAQGPLKVSAGIVTPITMQEDVYATGNVIPNSRQEVHVLSPGLVSKVAVKVGDTVKVGQILVALDSTAADVQAAQAQANVDAAQASVKAAQSNLDDLKKAQSAAQASAGNAGAGQGSMGIVNISGTGGGSVNGSNSSGAVVSGNSLPTGFSSNSMAGSGAVHQAEGTLAQSQAALKQAQEALKLAQVQQNQLNYKAAIAGTVLEVNVQVGDLAAIQLPMVIAADLSQMKVAVQLNEMDAGKVQAGGKVTVTSKTLGSTSLTGVIEKIAPEAVAQASVQGNASPTVAVTIRLDKVPAGLKPGYNVNIQAIAATKKGVLAVPQESLFQEGNKNLVYRIQDGRLYKTEVKVGIGNDTHQEITAGLKSGDRIVLNPSNALTEGMSVVPEQGSGGA